MKNLFTLLILFSVLSFSIISCDSNNKDPDPEISSGITMSLKTTGGDETEFIVNQENIMEGEISAVGTGIEQTGWRFFTRLARRFSRPATAMITNVSAM
jgi:hypothetical protein